MTELSQKPIEYYATNTSPHFEPYRHQTAAWSELDKHFVQRGAKAGIVVVPTGGGKTAIAVHWLMRQHVAQGGRVLWLAHRRGLLWQAREGFRRFAGLGAPKERIGTVVIASDAASWSSVAQDHDIVLSSVQSAVREHNLSFIDHMATQSPGGLFVVIDEAHHGAAPSYRKVVNVAREAGAQLLGLTATPVRMDPDDERRLWQMFETIVFQVDKRDLTAQGILATPHFKTVDTKVDFERDFTKDELTHLQQYGALAASVLRRVATNSGRNKLIVEHFAKNRAKYGKTIVFACDTTHVTTLVAEFEKAGVSVDYADYTRGDNADVMIRFMKDDAPQVLVNVEMLTEGFDAPRTKTVLIARPTGSEALVAQMVGRGLRGPQAGGTAEAHLVTFVDTWRNFKVLDAEYTVNAGAVEEATPRERKPQQLLPIPDELVLEAYKLVQSTARGMFDGTYQCLPHAWFVWEQELADDIRTRRVLVFENQVEGYARLEEDVKQGKVPSSLTPAQAEHVVNEYFGDTPDPRPPWSDIADLVAVWTAQASEVLSYTFEEKAAFDPARLAREFREADLGDRAQEERLRAIFDTDAVCRVVYRNDFRAFLEDVNRERTALADVGRDVLPEILEVVPDRELRPFPEGEAGHSLTDLLETVAKQKRHFPKGPPRIRDIAWSRRFSRRYWGFCRYDPPAITINCALNSPDVPRVVLELLVFHEMLHADMPNAGHNRDFRERERRFVPSQEAIDEATRLGMKPGNRPDAWRVLADQFLDTLNQRYALPGTRMKK